MTNESIGSLFAAAVIPGLILAGMFCIYVAIIAGKDKNIQRSPRASFNEILEATKGASGGLVTIVIIMAGSTPVFLPQRNPELLPQSTVSFSAVSSTARFHGRG